MYALRVTRQWGGVSEMSIWEETLGQNQDMLDRLYLLVDMEMLWDSPEELVELAEERSVWASLKVLADPGAIGRWTDGWH